MKKILTVIVLIIVGLGALSYMKVEDDFSLNPTETPSASPTPSGGIQKFSSKDLGIEFMYDDDQSNVKVDGKKVYVHVDPMNPESGQSVEVFEKRTNESFSGSIRRQILANFPSPVCKIDILGPSQIYPTYDAALITYPEPSDPKDSPWENAKLCNEQYAHTNGIGYFLYDSKHPDRFVFVSVGQYLISAGNVPWQDTIKFIDR